MQVRNITVPDLAQRIKNCEEWLGVAFLDYGSGVSQIYRDELKAYARRNAPYQELYFVDAAENPSVVRNWGITSIPALFVFYKGKQITRYDSPLNRRHLKYNFDFLFSLGGEKILAEMLEETEKEEEELRKNGHSPNDPELTEEEFEQELRQQGFLPPNAEGKP